MSAKGTALIDFGGCPGSFDCSVAVTGQAGIKADSACEAWLSSEQTADHSSDEHALAPIRLRVTDVTEGVGFTIQAVSDWQLTGLFSARWVWV